MENETNDLVRYVDVGAKYFRSRQLRKEANWLLLWGLAVASTMFAHLFGWNFGLIAGGFWGMVIATGVVALMYVGLVFSIAELSAALPHTGLLCFYPLRFWSLGRFDLRNGAGSRGVQSQKVGLHTLQSKRSSLGLLHES